MATKRDLKAREKVRIDENILNSLLEAKGMSREDLSAEIYKGKTFISNTFRQYDGWIKKLYLSGIAKALNVSEDVLLYKESALEPEPEPKQEFYCYVSEMTDTELSELIYKAVYSAVKHAWENDEE